MSFKLISPGYTEVIFLTNVKFLQGEKFWQGRFIIGHVVEDSQSEPFGLGTWKTKISLHD